MSTTTVEMQAFTDSAAALETYFAEVLGRPAAAKATAADPDYPETDERTGEHYRNVWRPAGTMRWADPRNSVWVREYATR